MSGWDGNGNFVMPYSMVAQAQAGVKILATVQDAQWSAVATGLMNCMTRDSQTKPTADVDLATHKLLNVVAPINPTDGANKSYVDAAVGGVVNSEWFAETTGVAWVSTTSFYVAGVNKTALYHAGRRVKITHNSGATVSYGTVVSSSFSTNTTVVVAMDGGTPLVATVTAVSYGLLSYVNPSYLDPRSAVCAYTVNQNIPATVLTTLLHTNVLVDTLGEYNPGNGRFTPIHPGVYAILADYNPNQTGTNTGTTNSRLYISRNTTTIVSKVGALYSVGSGASMQLCAMIILPLVVGDYVSIQAEYDWVGNSDMSTLTVARIA